MKFKTQHKFNFENININEVLNALEKLKTSKSTGHDNIPAKLLKDASDAVAPFLVFIFNTSLKHGNFPDDLKTARISPIHNLVTKKFEAIIDRFPFFRLLLNYLRNLSVHSSIPF